MPGVLHEVLRELFAKRPDLLAPLLEKRLSLPSPGLVALDSEQTDARLKQLLPDAVLACPSADAPALVMIVEVHLQTDEVKRRVWPQYAATAHGRYRCPVVVVVVTPSSRVERWASRAIEIGPRHTMTPEVLGPSALPRLDAAAVRRTPVLAMLSTLAHTDDPDCAEQALETLDALAVWDEDADGRLADILEAALPAAVRARMEELMRTGKYEYQSEFVKKSGTSIIRDWGGGSYVSLGVHKRPNQPSSGATITADPPTYNIAARMRSTMWNDICDWIGDPNYPSAYASHRCE